MMKIETSVNQITLRDIILGGQDGLVNVLGIALGLYAANANGRVILIAGLAAAVSEAVSMGAVAYTSASADKNRLERPDGKQSDLIFSGIVVGITALIGAIIPLLPFILLSTNGTTTAGISIAIALSAIVLFVLGISKARSVGGVWWRSGLLILFIGMISAFAGFLVGLVLKT
jgi:VIT1/CCC1 family predicted Fe2+/Mn2+ transporter